MERKGIVVTALCPGDVQSDIARHSVAALTPDRYNALDATGSVNNHYL